MLNCSYNLGLRRLKAVIPEYPVGTAGELCWMIDDFLAGCAPLLGLASFEGDYLWSAPAGFFACNARSRRLYGSRRRNSGKLELDLLVAYKAHAGDARIDEIVRDMADELGAQGNQYPDPLPRMAQFELTLLDWAQSTKARARLCCVRDKCWPSVPQGIWV